MLKYRLNEDGVLDSGRIVSDQTGEKLFARLRRFYTISIRKDRLFGDNAFLIDDEGGDNIQLVVVDKEGEAVFKKIRKAIKAADGCGTELPRSL